MTTMSEAETDSESKNDSVRLFVGQIPKQMTESELISMFEEFARVDEVNIIKDKATKASRGCCFLTCPSKVEADKAIAACHNKKTLPGASSPLQVKYADGELERLEHKLFIGMLPKNISETEVYSLFSKYGSIKDFQLLRGAQQTSKGCAFLKYEAKEQALAAIEGLHGKHKMEGSTVPLVVKWADTDKERQARRAQKAQSHDPNSMQQHSMFGSLPMGYMPPYSGYGYQPPGTYGLMQYPLNQASLQNMIPQGTQGNGVRGGASPEVSPRNFSGIQSPGYVGSSYSGVPGLQYPLAYHGGMMGPRPSANSQGLLHPTNLHNNNAPPSPHSTSDRQMEGPPGANLFIYHIPQEFGDEELLNAFQGFGRILSVKVFIDKATGVSKCFGFVSYDSPASAQAAISVMNGFQLGGKKLKVQLKREHRESIKPF